MWRQNAQVRYRDLQEVEARALGLVSEGAPFAAICEAIATVLGQHDQTTRMGEMLARWLADEIILADTGASITS